MFNSLRIRLTLIFVVLTILPLVLVSSLIALRGFDTLQNTSIDLQGHQARQASTDLHAFFNERLNELGVLVDVYGFDTLDLNSQQDVLLALLAKQPAYYQLALVDNTGEEVFRLIRGQVISSNDLQNHANDPLFQAVVTANSPSFSAIYFSESARDRMISVALPITDIVSGAFKQVIIAEMRFQTVTETVLRNLDLAPGEEVYIVDTNGVVIAHRNPSFVLKETVYALPEADGRNVGLTGEDVVLAKNTIQVENLTLTAISEVQYSKAIGLATDLVSISAIITVVTLVIATIIVVWVVSRTVAPITKLSRVAQAIQAGDFSQKSDLNRKDEIGQFAVAFNAMSQAIQQRETNLREQADQLRIATAKAREAARVKGEFLANVSHELRTPLNAIIGFSDMLLAGMSGPLNEKQQHKMTRLKENGIRLLSLINDLLDLTRIEAGRLEMVEKPFSPQLLAERLSAQMESLAVESKLKFDTFVDPSLPQEIVGDQKRVEQVVVNLLSNAFKFTQEGSVTLSINANLGEQTWSVEVADTGIGIPPHAVNVIFEEFRQLDGSYSRAYKGSGLGLAITRNLVRMMGGKISVKSTLGTGSTFTVVLPLNQQPTLTPRVLELVPS
jgi:signal transduction histidine kinase